MDSEGVRRRRKVVVPSNKVAKDKEEGDDVKKDVNPVKEDLRHSYWLTRVVFLRSLALIYLVAFLVAFDQNEELIGDRGLLPLRIHLDRLREAQGESATLLERFCSTPTLLWLLEPWEEVRYRSINCV